MLKEEKIKTYKLVVIYKTKKNRKQSKYKTRNSAKSVTSTRERDEYGERTIPCTNPYKEVLVEYLNTSRGLSAAETVQKDYGKKSPCLGIQLKK